MPVPFENVGEHLVVDLENKTDNTAEKIALFFQELVRLVCMRCFREKIEKEDGITVRTGRSSKWLTEKLPNRFSWVFDSSLGDDNFFDKSNMAPLELEIEDCMKYGKVRTFQLYVLNSNFSLMYKGDGKFEISFHRGSDWNVPDPFIQTALEKVLKKEM